MSDIDYAGLVWGNVVIKKDDKFYYMGMESADDEVDCYINEWGAKLVDYADATEIQKWMILK